jgi:hypothetical protein
MRSYLSFDVSLKQEQDHIHLKPSMKSDPQNFLSMDHAKIPLPRSPLAAE